MFGAFEAIYSFITRQVGLRTDAADAAGSLHAKLKALPSVLWPDGPLFGLGILGDVTISANTSLYPAIYQYNNLTVNAGVTLSAADKGLILVVKNTLTVNGLITASGKGAPGGVTNRPPSNSVAAGTPGTAGYFGGGGGGGGSADGLARTQGGNGGATSIASGGRGIVGAGASGGNAANAFPFRSLRSLLDYYGGGGGGGGGMYYLSQLSSVAGGAGGGIIIIEAKNIVINSGGAIRADGLSGQNGTTDDYCGGGGGGGGGLIIIRASSITNYGTISANGGAGGTGLYAGGAGGAGLVIQVVV